MTVPLANPSKVDKAEKSQRTVDDNAYGQRGVRIGLLFNVKRQMLKQSEYGHRLYEQEL